MKGDRERAAGGLTREGKREAMDTKGNGESSVRRESMREEYLRPVASGWHISYSTKLTEKKTKRQMSGWRLLAEQGRSSLLSSVKPSLGRAASLHIQFGVWFNLHQCYFVWLVTLLNCFFFLICISQANALICFSKEFLSITRMRWLHYFITLLNSSGATVPINKPAW